MQFIKNYFVIPLLAIFLPLTLCASDYTVENQPQVIEKALSLESETIFNDLFFLRENQSLKIIRHNVIALSRVGGLLRCFDK